MEIAISHQVLWSTGDVKLWVDIDLLVKNNAGHFVPETFRVDTGTEISTYPAYRARQLDLPIPLKPNLGATHAQSRLEVRSGLLRFRIDGMDATEYAIACLFLGDPGVPPVPGGTAGLPKKLLQPFALLDQLRFVFDHDPASGMVYGHMIVDKK